MSAEKNIARLGLFGGPLFLALVLLVPPPEGLPVEGWYVAGISGLMATWWMTVAVPIPVTALLPLVLFPLMGVADMRAASAPYADPIIFLFMGGFMLGIAMQRWALHVRIGLTVLTLVGTAPQRLVAGMLLAAALVSMWVSNTATAIMMLPVAVSILTLIDERSEMDAPSRQNLGVVLVLAVAYGASIGGIGTLIGTPTNVFFAAYMLREHGVAIGFAQWMMLGVPLVFVLLGAAWLVLAWTYPVKIAHGADATSAVVEELRRLGPLSTAEIRVACIFALTAAAWIFRPLYGEFLPGIDDTLIAMSAAIALFLIPSGMVKGESILTWEDISEMPWGVLLLFGGGLSLAAAITVSGLAPWTGTLMQSLDHWPVIVIVGTAAVGMLFLTELTSNTASAAALLPLGSAVALGLGFDPLLIAVPLTVAASCAFMLPVGTPPNAIAYASGRVTIPQMAYAGFWLNILSSVVIIAMSYWVIEWMFVP